MYLEKYMFLKELITQSDRCQFQKRGFAIWFAGRLTIIGHLELLDLLDRPADQCWSDWRPRGIFSFYKKPPMLFYNNYKHPLKSTLLSSQAF